MSMTALPLELLLDILELLLAQRDKVSSRAAAGLAQACRSLRTSEAGKRARYFYVLTLLSMSVPSSLPADLDYEMEVLFTSRWPHEDPVDDPDESGQVFQLGTRYFNRSVITDDRLNVVEDATLKAAAQAIERASEAFLRADTVIALGASSRELLVGVAQHEEASWALDSHIAASADRHFTSPYSIARPETIDLRKVVRLDSKVTKIAVDSDEGKVCALVYAEREDDGRVVVEMRSVESGNVQASFTLRPASTYDELHSIQDVTLMGDYLHLEEHGGRTEVRRWRKGAAQVVEPDCPIVWQSPIGDAPYFLNLLAPHFMATRADRSRGIEFHRLDQPAGSTLVAILDLSVDFYDENALDYVVCGGKIAPGEEGLIVIQHDGTAWLLELSVLIGILCFGPSKRYKEVVRIDGNGVAFYSTEWITSLSNAYRFLPLRREFANWIPSVTGWKCAFIFGPFNPRNRWDLSYIKFLDASPAGSHTCNSSEHFPARSFNWKDRQCFTWDSPIELYLPSEVKHVKPAIARIELHGARLLLYYSPEPQTHGRSHVRLWRT